MSPLWGNGRKFTITNLQVSSSTPLHPYPGFSRDPRKHWAKNIFGRVQNRARLSVRAVRAFGRDTKTDDAGAAAQPKRRGRGAVRRANGLSADSTLDFRCRFARHRASPALFRPSGRPRAVGHETLRVTKGHENARPSVVSDNRRCQAAQAASGNANSRGRKGHLLMFLMWAKRPFSLIALGKRSAFIIFFIAVFLSLAIGNIVIGNTSTS